MVGMEKLIECSQISYTHKELMKIRACQIYGYAYSLQIQTADAEKAGKTDQRIYTLCVWKDSSLFSIEEKSLLAITDEVKQIADKGLIEQTYELAKNYSPEIEIGKIIMQIAMFKAWKRIAISTHIQHPVV